MSSVATTTSVEVCLDCGEPYATPGDPHFCGPPTGHVDGSCCPDDLKEHR